MKKRICITVIIVCLSVATITVFFYKNIKVSQKIINYCDEQEKMNLEIAISDYTNFDWETLIIYKNPVSRKELFEATGIDYKKELDLQSGMIFTKDNDIVYEECFETNFESPHEFIIYPYGNINTESSINQFSTKNAIFNVEKKEHNKENRYVLKPIR